MADADTRTDGAARTGARLLVDQLVAQGVSRAACVPGESYLPVLDAMLGSGIDLLTCRQEGGAAMMAEAWGKLSGRPGVCLVTRGPGATNAAAGVHVARQDSTPMILFVGQVARDTRGREGFQELDYAHVFGGLAKWVVEIDRAARIPELVARAFRVAMQGRPGPVVVALPEDMLDETASVADAPRVEPVATAVPAAAVEQWAQLLARAERPLVVAGGSRWTTDAVAALRTWAGALDLPVACSFRRAQLFPADDARFVGDLGLGPNPVLADYMRSADLVLLLGGRFAEVPSGGYQLLDVPGPRQALVHVHPDADELGRVYQPALAVEATPGAFLTAVAGKTAPARWAAARAALRDSYLAWSGTPAAVPGAFNYGEAITWLRDRLPPDAIICNGAGNFAAWVHRYWRFRGFGTQLAPTSGSMGYGVPAAIAAKRMNPERVVVAFAGDGDFLMTGQEFATAVHHGVPVVVLVIDNGMYGTIRMHQERRFPGRPAATALTSPDFAGLARAFGGHGETVERTAQFAPAFERALASRRPAIVHCRLDPRAIAPGVILPDA